MDRPRMRICHTCAYYDMGYEVCKKKEGNPKKDWDDTCTIWCERQEFMR